MRTKTLRLSLSLALLLAPGLPALAAEAAPEAPAQPVPASEPTPVKRPGQVDAPELPEAHEGDAVPAEALEGVSGTAATEVEVPKEDLVAPGKEKPDEPESPYKWGNFALGFLGGAVIGGAAGVLFMSRDDKGAFDSEKAKVMGPAVGAGAGLVFGLAALLLGATTPEEAKPPKVETGLLPLKDQPQALADAAFRLDLRF